MSEKRRLSATVDAKNLEAAHRAFEEGRAPSISHWVNGALARQAEHDARMRALDEFLATYEDEHGVITNEEITAASRNVRQRAIVVRGESPGKPAPYKPNLRTRSARRQT